ncbi:MAG: hypothetical protein RIT07_975 [Bacteroidota bacterium]|jgi:hypothetical protein
MEVKLLKLARICAVLILLLNGVYTTDEFLKPQLTTTTCSEAFQGVFPNGNRQYTVVLANHSQIEVDHAVILPSPGQRVVSYRTPLFGGLKAIDYEVQDLSGNQLVQTLGNPNGPRTLMLLVSGILLLLCIVVLTVRFEFAVGTLIFTIVLAGVRFWILK